ncbi:MAG: glycosyltransferase family 4 protein [Clostridia bacterium]|nr:glycosyltransferase family 4 protein [Clostridia bacterium]
MRMLMMSPYYPPEQISSSRMDRELDDAFLEAGFTLVNHVPMPTRGVSSEVRRAYRSRRRETLADGRIAVHRFPMFGEGRNPLLRALRYVLVNLVQYWHGSRTKDADVIFAGSTPPTQGLLCAMVKRKLKIPFVYNLQDVFPDSLVNAGMTAKGSLIWRVGRWVENLTYRNADRIIVISQSMKRNIVEKGVPEDRIAVVPNWIDVEAVRPVARENNRLFEEFGIPRDRFIVVYAGNFGATQGADVVLRAAELLRDEADVQFVVFGGGAEFEQARVQAQQLSNVIISGLLPQERVPEVYSLGHAALITCRAGVGSSGMPSKTWSIMACNTPVIASFDMDSELAEILRESGAGSCVPAGDAQALAQEIRSSAQRWREGRLKAVNSRAYVQEHASRAQCTRKYVEAVLSVLEQ